MGKDSTIYTRIEDKEKREFEGLVASMGMSSSQAIRLFIKQTILQKAIPFRIGIPNATTNRALHEADSGELTSHGSFKELREDLDV